MSLSIATEYERSLALARSSLARLPFAQGSADNVRGISGWVFEQILLKRILKSLNRKGIKPKAQQQVRITGRATADIAIGSVAIEAKVSGAYEDTTQKYRKYRAALNKMGWHYLYVTLQETYPRNVKQAREAFGRDNAFFLDQSGNWKQLIARIVQLNRIAEQEAGGYGSPVARRLRSNRRARVRRPSA